MTAGICGVFGTDILPGLRKLEPSSDGEAYLTPMRILLDPALEGNAEVSTRTFGLSSWSRSGHNEICRVPK